MDISEQVLKTLRQIVRGISLHSKKLMQRSGLSTPQLLVLREVSQHGEMPTGVLSSNISLSHATVTSILDRLVAKGLVERRRSETDRRKVLVQLSEAGKTKLQEAPSLLQEEFTERFDKLQPWEQSLILSSLQRVVTMMQAAELPASPLLTTEEI